MQLGTRQEWVEYGEAQDLGWEWERDDIDLFILDSEWTVKPSLPIWKYAQNIPVHYRELATPYKLNQLRFLQLLAGYPEARDLAEHNPNLLWLLACSTCRRNYSPQQIRDHLRKKQVNLLSSLISRPASKKAINFLRRVSVNDGDHHFYELLLDVLRDEKKMSLFTQKWRNIPQSAIYLIRKNNPDALLKCLGTDLDNSDPSDWNYKIAVTDRLWDDLLRLAKTLGNTRSEWGVISSLRSIKQMQKLHDRLSTKIRKQEINDFFMYSKVAKKSFPESPIRENENIVQIKNYKGLFLEGEAMRHCACSQAECERVFNGDTFYYRICWPERCTLEIKKDINGWGISELKLEGNNDPSIMTREYVHKWLLESVITPQ